MFGYHGYRSTGIMAMFPAMLMISVGESPPTVIKGWVVKDRHIYSGDRMPPGTYDDQWIVAGFRDADQNEFGKEVLVWSHKELSD